MHSQPMPCNPQDRNQLDQRNSESPRRGPSGELTFNWHTLGCIHRTHFRWATYHAKSETCGSEIYRDESLPEEIRSMVIQNHIGKHAGQLQLSMDSDSCAVLSIHRDTPLREVVPRLSGQHYVLATDNDGHITGIVSVVKIHERLESTNQYERQRWQQMPLSALLNVTFDQKNSASAVTTEQASRCVAITEGDRIFGLAIENDLFLSWRRLESLLSVALSDPLTGLLNRLAYERRLTEEWSRAVRTGMSVGVILIDLDQFKRINDTYGHQTGDAVLRGVSHELEASVRSYDVVARFGGDEFVALCLGCSSGDITIPVKRIQQGISNMNLMFEDSQIPVTISIGAAVRHSGFQSSAPLDLFSAADECLYHAKASPESSWKVELGDGHSEIPEPVGFGSQPNPAGNLSPSLNR